MTDFFAMGGYALYVWTAYGLSAMVLIGGAVVTLRTLKARQDEFDRLSAQPHKKKTQTIDDNSSTSNPD